MRILLAMRENSRREQFRLLLESERSDCSVSLAGDGRSAMEAIRQLAPDVLVLDHILPLQDGPAVLNKLMLACMPCPPKVIYLLAYGQNPEDTGGEADLALCACAGFQELMSAIKKTESMLQGKLAMGLKESRSAMIRDHFHQLGMPPRLKGQAYLAYLLDLVIPSPGLLDSLTARLYPAAASRFSTTPAAVERCIRHAIEATWSRGDMAALERLFGLSIDPDRGKPTTREFLAMSAQHLRFRENF